MIGKTWKWCLDPHTEDEIRERVLTDYNDICFNYLCSYSPMSEEFRKELAVLSLGKTVVLPGSDGNDGEIIIVPYITKKNYKKVYPIFRNMYFWVQGGFKGAPDLKALDIVGLKKSLNTSLENACKRKEKLKNAIAGVDEELNDPKIDEDKTKSLTEDKIKLLIEKKVKLLTEKKERLFMMLNNTDNTINDYRNELLDLDSLYEGHEIKDKRLMDDLQDIFTDRLPIR